MEISRITSSNPFPVSGLIWREMSPDRIKTSAVDDVFSFEGRAVAPVISLPASLAAARPRRRREWVAGRLCALAATTDLGRPCVPPPSPDGPCWPDGIRGSIAHHRHRVIAVASRLYRLGVDCEIRLSPDRACAIEAQVCTPDEPALRPPGLTSADAVTILFSAKEALYKALSDRIKGRPDWRAARTAGWDQDRLLIAFAGSLWPVLWQQSADDVTTLAVLPLASMDDPAFSLAQAAP